MKKSDGQERRGRARKTQNHITVFDPVSEDEPEPALTDTITAMRQQLTEVHVSHLQSCMQHDLFTHYYYGAGHLVTTTFV